jgi:hypothetical protein
LYEKKAREAKIQISKLPSIDVARLFRMSIERTSPFEGPRVDKSEKGFRDALIMFTISEDIKRRPEDSSLVVTQDELLRKASSPWLERQHDLSVGLYGKLTSLSCQTESGTLPP